MGVRIRPLQQQEKAAGEHRSWKASEDDTLVCLEHDKGSYHPSSYAYNRQVMCIVAVIQSSSLSCATRHHSIQWVNCCWNLHHLPSP